MTSSVTSSNAARTKRRKRWRQLRRQRNALQTGVDQVHRNGKLEAIESRVTIAVGERPDVRELSGGQFRPTKKLLRL